MTIGEDAVFADPTAPPTIYDVARAAGVSIASVSRVLNGQRNPRQETRERVLAAVADLGFVPDGAARAYESMGGAAKAGLPCRAASPRRDRRALHATRSCSSLPRLAASPSPGRLPS